MNSKRVPLASNPQAVNSPLRPIGASKRSRDQIGDHRAQYDVQQHPKKKQLLETTHHGLQRTKAIPANHADARVFDAKPTTANASSFQRKLVASKVESRARQPEREADRTKSTDKEQVKTWQRHYRKVFPNFVFYFESLPEEARQTAVRAIAHLGAVRQPRFLLVLYMCLTSFTA